MNKKVATRLLPSLKKKKILKDHKEPCPPYFLKAEDYFPNDKGREIFIKKIYSVARTVPRQGSVVMAPGIATNANIFRVDDSGDMLSLENSRSFANLLASEGFTVYLYNPGFTERVHNRYVKKYCKNSIYHGKSFSAPSTLTFAEMVHNEIPMVIDFVRKDSRRDRISWIGYSLGGMMIYSYLSQNTDEFIGNVITIASPITLSQIFIRVIPYTNMASKALGFEESALLGTLSENLVPLTRMIRRLPGWLLRYNLLTMILCNPLNIKNTVLKTLLGKIVEPIPSSLETCFADIIFYGSSSYRNYSSYLQSLHKLRKTGKNFLFFFGPNDVIASPDSVFLAHEIISPGTPGNMIEVPSAGHVDIIVGRNSMDKVWKPALEWLKEKAL